MESRTTVLVNIEFEDPFGIPMVAEVQLILHAFLVIKRTLHKFYRFVRASGHDAVLASPIFRSEASAPRVEPSRVVEPLENFFSLAELRAQYRRASEVYLLLGNKDAGVAFESALERLGERISKLEAG